MIAKPTNIAICLIKIDCDNTAIFTSLTDSLLFPLHTLASIALLKTSLPTKSPLLSYDEIYLHHVIAGAKMLV
jgi:hypothetical protein